MGFLDQIGAVESVKFASDVYAPLSGQVFRLNDKAYYQPSLISQSPESKGTNSVA